MKKPEWRNSGNCFFDNHFLELKQEYPSVHRLKMALALKIAVNKSKQHL